jgi:hypothetical protein
VAPRAIANLEGGVHRPQRGALRRLTEALIGSPDAKEEAERIRAEIPFLEKHGLIRSEEPPKRAPKKPRKGRGKRE